MTAARPGPAFSVHDIPFSTYGSWFGISPVVAENTHAEDLHLVSHQTGMHAVLRLTPMDATGERASTRIEAAPDRLSWVGQAGRVDIAYESPDTVRLRGSGLSLRVLAAARVLTPFSGTYFYREPHVDAYVFTSYETGRRYRITLLSAAVARAAGPRPWQRRPRRHDRRRRRRELGNRGRGVRDRPPPLRLPGDLRPGRGRRPRRVHDLRAAEQVKESRSAPRARARRC
ncbi:hypothetical protein SBADM41S_05706 [Streptomyces badius]